MTHDQNGNFLPTNNNVDYQLSYYGDGSLWDHDNKWSPKETWNLQKVWGNDNGQTEDNNVKAGIGNSWFHGPQEDTFYDYIDNDYNGEAAEYVGVLKKDNWATSVEYNHGDWGEVYAIKQLGTNNAYAIRWQVKKVGQENELTNFGTTQSYKGRGVLVISKYKVSPDTRFKTITGEDNIIRPDLQALKTMLNWDTPSGQIELPISGYVWAGNGSSWGQGGLIYSGSECLYWTSNYTLTNRFAVSARIKYSGGYWFRNLYFNDEEYRSSGGQIRCVRDTNVKD